MSTVRPQYRYEMYVYDETEFGRVVQRNRVRMVAREDEEMGGQEGQMQRRRMVEIGYRQN